MEKPRQTAVAIADEPTLVELPLRFEQLEKQAGYLRNILSEIESLLIGGTPQIEEAKMPPVSADNLLGHAMCNADRVERELSQAQKIAERLRFNCN